MKTCYTTKKFTNIRWFWIWSSSIKENSERNHNTQDCNDINESYSVKIQRASCWIWFLTWPNFGNKKAKREVTQFEQSDLQLRQVLLKVILIVIPIVSIKLWIRVWIAQFTFTISNIFLIIIFIVLFLLLFLFFLLILYFLILNWM